jgi:hypothetical protein
VLPVVIGESIRLGSLIGNRRIERRLLHVRPDKSVLTQTISASYGQSRATVV